VVSRRDIAIMAGQRITIQVLGSPDDDGHPRLSELIKQLEFVHSALNNTERLITGDTRHDVYFRVVDASHKSPVTIVLEPAQRKKASGVARRTINGFVANLRKIKQGKPVRDVDLQALESYRNLTSMLDKNVAALAITGGLGKTPVNIDRKFKDQLEEIIGPDETIIGSAEGKLEWLNIHNQNVFNIYPNIGARKITCHFKPELRRTVIEAIDRYVIVHGTLRYKQRERFPYAADVAEIEVVPEYDQLPLMADLQGIAPNATGKLTADDYVQKLRHEDF
jgi:hypothetical protein